MVGRKWKGKRVNKSELRPSIFAVTQAQILGLACWVEIPADDDALDSAKSLEKNPYQIKA